MTKLESSCATTKRTDHGAPIKSESSARARKSSQQKHRTQQKQHSTLIGMSSNDNAATRDTSSIGSNNINQLCRHTLSSMNKRIATGQEQTTNTRQPHHQYQASHRHNHANVLTNGIFNSPKQPVQTKPTYSIQSKGSDSSSKSTRQQPAPEGASYLVQGSAPRSHAKSPNCCVWNKNYNWTYNGQSTVKKEPSTNKRANTYKTSWIQSAKNLPAKPKKKTSSSRPDSDKSKTTDSSVSIKSKNTRESGIGGTSDHSTSSTNPSNSMTSSTTSENPQQQTGTNMTGSQFSLAGKSQGQQTLSSVSVSSTDTFSSTSKFSSSNFSSATSNSKYSSQILIKEPSSNPKTPTLMTKYTDLLAKSDCNSPTQASQATHGTWKLRETYRKESTSLSTRKSTPSLLEHHINSKSILDSNHAELTDSGSSPTFSTESSFSFSYLGGGGEENAHKALSSPFQNRSKSVALCYYHHLYSRRQESTNLQPLYNYTYKNSAASVATKDHSKFSEYGSTRFSSHQNNFSGNYATFEENKKFLDTLTKTLSRRHETYTEKTVDKLLSQILANTKRRSQSIDQVISSKPPPPPPHVIAQQQSQPDMSDAIRPVKVINSEYQCEFIDKWSEQSKQARTNFENVKCSSPNHTVYESLETFGKTDESSLSKIPKVDCSVASVNTNSASRTTNEDRTTSTTTSKVEINLASLNRQTVSNPLTYLADKKSSLNRPLHISIDTNKVDAGLLSADITLNNKKVKFDLKKVSSTKYEIQLLPRSAGTYKVRLLLNGLTVKGSPFVIKIDSGARTDTTTEMTNLDQSSTKSSTDLTQNSTSDLDNLKPIQQDTIITPSQRRSPLKQQSTTYRTELIACTDKSNLVVGKEFKVSMLLLERIPSSKTRCNKLPPITASKMTATVKFNNSELIEHKLEQPNGKVCQITATPHKAGSYFVSLLRDGQILEGCPYKLVVSGGAATSKANQKRIIKSNYAQVGVPYFLTLENYDTKALQIDISRKMVCSDSSSLTSVSRSTSSSTISFSSIKYQKIVETKNKLVIKFLPLEPVEHSIDIIDAGKPLKNCPIRFNVFHNWNNFILSERMSDVRLGDTARFVLKLNDDEKSSLSLRISDTQALSTYHVTFLLNDEYLQTKHIYGALCKFLRLSSMDRITNDVVQACENGHTRVSFYLADRDLEQHQDASAPNTTDHFPATKLLRELREIINNDKYVIIDIGLKKTIMAIPSTLEFQARGQPIEFELKKKDFELSLLEFRPTHVGQFRCDFECFGKAITNSPCFVNVYDPDQAAKVIRKPSQFIVGTDNFIRVNLATSIANCHPSTKFECWAEAPSGALLPMGLVRNSQKLVKLVPVEAGIHVVHMRLGEHFLADTPFEINAVLSELPLANGTGLHSAVANQPAVFRIVAPDNLEGNLNIEIKGSDVLNNVRSFVKKLNKNEYEVTYFAMEVGVFMIYIKWNELPIYGSPFKARVVNPAKVNLLSSTSSHAKSILVHVGEENALVFDTMGAGPGVLNVQVVSNKYERLPVRQVVRSQKINGQLVCYFRPTHEGEFTVEVDWNNYKTNLGPIVCHTHGYSLANRVKISGEGLNKAIVGKLAEFEIDTSRIDVASALPGPAKLKVYMTNIFNEPEEETVISVSSRDGHYPSVVSKSQSKYRCSYLASSSGNYLMNVTVDDLHVGGSPFELRVNMEADPGKVLINKDDLRSAIFGNEIRTLIDTSGAGVGELTANCFGPSRAALCHFEDKKNGLFLLTIKPSEVGKHQLMIKYNDEHVLDSPFTMRIFAPPDATKVKVSGSGICHGVLSDFRSEFICDTKGAGAGQLTVRIRGPKSSFRVEMQRENEKDRKIMCKYDPLEAGEYQINVKWSGEHVPNSPFNVRIFRAREEMNKYFGTVDSPTVPSVAKYDTLVSAMGSIIST